MKFSKEQFGRTDTNVFLFCLENDNHVKTMITNLGAAVVQLSLPDQKNGSVNVVLGYGSPEEYLNDRFYMGAVVGRFSGRISRGGFKINNQFYSLFENDPENKIHLHGGKQGFNKKIFRDISVQQEPASQSLTLYYRSKDGEEGYPGNLDLWVSYSLTNENEFIVQYRAKSDKATHVNFTNHSYFNLTGKPEKALKQELLIDADSILVTDHLYIPTGKTQAVENTIYDFRQVRPIDVWLNEPVTMGYNECYVLNSGRDKLAAVLADPFSKRKMTITTTAPGLVFYTANKLEGKFTKCQGICLEPECFPDTPNQPAFPTTLLHPGQEMFSQTTYRFSW